MTTGSSSTSKGVRAKRFQLKAGCKLTLTIETELGDKVDFNVKNASMSGLAAVAAKGLKETSAFSVNKLLPESKLTWEGNEVPLGRLVVRSFESNQETGEALVGFSCVDSKVPLFGNLSKLFDSLSKGEENAFDLELNAKKYSLASFLETDHSNYDLFHKCKEYDLLRNDFLKNPLFQYYAVRHEANGLEVKLSLPRRKTPARYINFASYDYFGFSSDPEVKEAAIKAVERFGVSATATPPLAGNTSLHEELEGLLARTLRKEDALVFTSGFAANVGSLTAILGGNDLAVADILSHASIHDGLSASNGRVRLFRHNNNRHLKTLLEEHRNKHSGALTVTEGLYSMDGDVPALDEFIRISKQYECRTFIDEVHSFGVIGPAGLGAAERYGVLDDIDIYTGSLSKGMGAGGGFVAGSRELISWFRSFSRTEMFSSALSPSCVAAAIKSITLMTTQPERRLKLLNNIRQFHEGLKEMGCLVKSDIESPIVPVIIGDQEVMGRMNQILIEHGVFVNPIIFPAVSVTGCRLRFSLSSSHSYSDIQLALIALKRAAESTQFSFARVNDGSDARAA